MAEFEFKGYKVHYEEYGQNGNPLIVLNGIMMSTGSWAPFIENFSKNNVLILVDFIDQGKSSSATQDYNHDLQVELVNELVERLWYSEYTIMGISYGGEVALQYAIEHPDKVKRLILANTASRTSAWLSKIGKGWNSVALTKNAEAYYLCAIPVIYSAEFFEKKKDWMDSREEYLIKYFDDPVVRDRLLRLVNSSEDYDVSDRLDEVKCPTLIISSTEDFLTPLPEQRFMHDRIKNSQWVTINGCGHASMYENPQVFAALVSGFANLSDDEIKI